MSEYTVTHLKSTGSIAPSSWTGTTAEGPVLFFRYRWGELTIRTESETGDILFQEQLHEDESRSHLSRQELEDHLPDNITLNYL